MSLLNLFCFDELEKAYEEFKISVDKISALPVEVHGWIHENLGNNKQAIAEYNELLKMKTSQRKWPLFISAWLNFMEKFRQVSFYFSKSFMFKSLLSLQGRKVLISIQSLTMRPLLND